MWHTKYIFFTKVAVLPRNDSAGRVHYLSEVIEVLLKKVLLSGFDCADSATPIYINFCYVFFDKLSSTLLWPKLMQNK